MLEKDIEKYLVHRVAQIGGKAYKFVSPSNRGVSDRIVCLPDGTTHFIELKRPGGKLSPLQALFLRDMERLNQSHDVLWSKQEVDQWILDHTNTTQPTSSLPTTEP
jgi:hypothetical protein